MYKKGDKVKLTLNSKPWTGNYASQEVEIVGHMSGSNYTVKASDGYTFMCPSSYFQQDLPEIPCNSISSSVDCECGAFKVYGENCPSFYHMFYCRLYKPPEE